MKKTVKKVAYHAITHKELFLAAVFALLFFGALVSSLMMFGILRTEQIRRAVDTVQNIVTQAVPITPQVRFAPSHTKLPISVPQKSELSVQANAAVIIDAQSGGVLFAKNADKKRAIASTTKLLTAMVVVDQVADVNAYISLSQQMLNVEGVRVGCSTSYVCEGNQLHVGERVRIHDLLKAMLIPSANDAANALAIHVAGSEEAFAMMMNEKMKSMQLSSSNFCRPSGLDLDNSRADQSCFSTARDVGHVAVAITQEAKYAVLLDILTQSEAQFFSEDGTIEHSVKTTNRLLEDGSILAGKTGFTPRAGRSFVGIAEAQPRAQKIITVVLDSPDRFGDTELMIEWATRNYKWQ